VNKVQEKLLPGELGVSAGVYDHTPLHESPKSGGPRGLKASIESNRKERSHEPERSEELAWQELLSGSSLTRCFLIIDDAGEAGIYLPPRVQTRSGMSWRWQEW
jgi:hypothetical protein